MVSVGQKFREGIEGTACVSFACLGLSSDDSTFEGDLIARGPGIIFPCLVFAAGCAGNVE